MSRSKQLGFYNTYENASEEFRDYWKQGGRRVHGGVYSGGKRKTARPFSNKKPIHLIVRSSRARGTWSFWKHKNKIKKIIDSYAQACGIRIYKYSNNGNHLHILLQARDHALFKRFLRTTMGLIPRIVTGAKRSEAKGKFWDALAFTRLAEWGKAFRTVEAYVLQNILEAAGVVPYKPRKYKLIESTA